MSGIIIIILGSLGLAVQNVLIRVIFASSSIFGQLEWGGFLAPSPGHSLLILALRSLLVCPIIFYLSQRWYPETRPTLQRLLQPIQRQLLVQAVVASALLFLALALFFMAIAIIPAGVAIVLFFTHPITTGLIAWFCFGYRPSRLRLLVTCGVLIGSILVAPPISSIGDQAALGVGLAITASFAYSGQGLLAQVCFRQMNPIPFTVVNFVVMALLSNLSLLVFSTNVPPTAWPELLLIIAFTAGLTLAGQLAYNIGIQKVSAAAMAIVAVSNPMFTVLMAWIGLSEMLIGRQWLGIAIILISILSLSRDRPVPIATTTAASGTSERIKAD